MRWARASSLCVPMDSVNPPRSNVTAVSFSPQSEPPASAASGAVQRPLTVSGPHGWSAAKLHTAAT